MSFHAQSDRWLTQTDPASCPVCNQAPMPEDIVDLTPPGGYEKFITDMRAALNTLCGDAVKIDL